MSGETTGVTQVAVLIVMVVLAIAWVVLRLTDATYHDGYVEDDD